MTDFNTLQSWLEQEERLVTFKEFAHCSGMGCKSYEEANDLLKRFVSESKTISNLNTVHVVPNQEGEGVTLNQNQSLEVGSILAIYKGPTKELKDIARLCAISLDKTRYFLFLIFF